MRLDISRHLSQIESRQELSEGEHRLAAAVITRALVDYIQALESDTLINSRRIITELKHWFENDSGDYSFGFLCDSISETGALKETILHFINIKDGERLSQIAKGLLSMGILGSGFSAANRGYTSKVYKKRYEL